ncbi:dTDP-glucose 4,6-dehydratase [Catellatospora sp. KI3]|uniref:dTDP-glucose 4,6-dehydratase n=1 Tax=Catellatospora sp. KI3 TaxID=3041620 RepID=UPI0024832605|nr:dTDP-glucose 4,6-dehydratase [Catellatospora sp. KI3]MDI1464529.1 dTDP-glucose 4,6-dehydratase [Catellatospora sp. KI3]
MKILVTGGAGFIGSNYARTQLSDARGDAVTVLDKLTYCGNRDNLAPVADSPRLTFVEGDICDADLVDELIPGHDAIVHFAAETHVDRSVRTAAGFVRTNVLGTQVLLDAALRHGVGRFVHVSTDEVYGSIEHGTWREEQPLAPRSPYSAAKAGSDLLALAYHATHGLDVVVTRCANNYGPYQFPEKIIPLFTTNLLDGLPVPLYGDGTQVREWLHVDDHCAAVDLVLRRGRPGEVYHVGGTAELTNRELAGRLLAATGRGWDLVRTVADRKGHDRRYALDDTKIRERLGYAPRVDFATGLADTVAWYRDHRAWWEPLKKAAALP